MNKIIRLLNKVLSTFCVSLCSVLVACVVWQVFSRYVLSSPSTYTDEIARFLFIWVGLMGAAYTLGQKKHLAIDLLAQKLENSPSKENVLRLIINLVSLFFVTVIMTYGGGKLVMQVLSTGQVSPALGVEMGWIYSAIPLSGIFMLIYLFQDFIQCLNTLKSPASHSSEEQI
ncbi:TRAP transporter small permease [Gynuella sunshinyii]|uniref:TRAP transporter small permease protein n=1 Tax=Gynuella sunshinyii YC6258 TaxID=1445510 RepID=A0A0C5VMT3_9GAMM|nr:TRAP transporter small permease [Gynuella sunshinyii]AJQ96042.1 TRAP-type C4-dicarboxylate transport system, small permease component [Gynuella sunshinyii YC6258]